MANKADLKDAISASEIHLSLGLDLIRNRSWHIVATCALKGQGLVAGIEWLSVKIKEYLEQTAAASS
jgi:signal recognition particle receptor subunit beta